jgi:hypothetical protein
MKNTLIAVAFLSLLAASTTAVNAATVFSDSFGSSTLNAAIPASQTATSSNYAVLSSKNAVGSTIGAGSLKVANVPTSSGLTEVQALFSAAPLSLTADGDYIELRATFVPNGVLYAATSNPSFNAGLFNSHGTTPVTGGQMNNAQLNATDTSFPFGFAAGWEGYATRVQTTSAQVYTRPAQSDTTNESQDLLFNNSATGAFDNPAGAALTPNLPSGVTFVNGSTYTYTLRLTQLAGILDIVQNVYQGADASGPTLLTHLTSSMPATTLTTQFDGFALGFRSINEIATPVTEHSLTFSLIEVTTNLPVPEPGSAALLAAACVAACCAYRRPCGRTHTSHNFCEFS